MEGTIFDIKEFSIHDGPGIRVTVFMKGCPLRCIWCHNPEGLEPQAQLLYKKNLCSHCGNCMIPCRHSECRPWKRCIHACANGCLAVSGRRVTEKEAAEQIFEYSDFFNLAEGGVTISGGEPLLQADFVCALAQRLGGMHKAIQTSGYTDGETYKRVIDHFDLIMQDIKLADPAMHRKYTGVDNEPILRNIEYLKKSGKQFVFRVPLIPGITDVTENLMEISGIVGDSPVELLKYNPLAGAKYDMLGLRFPLGEVKNREEKFESYFQNAVLVE